MGQRGPCGGAPGLPEASEGRGGEGNGVQGQSQGARGCDSCRHGPPCCCNQAHVRGDAVGDWAEGRAVTTAREGPQWLWGPREGSTFICCLFFLFLIFTRFAS